MLSNNPNQSGNLVSEQELYGRYQWNIKYNGWYDQFEIEEARFFFLGKNFNRISRIIGRDIECSLEGRSSGWFTVHSELSSMEQEDLSVYINRAMRDLPSFLEDLRMQFKEEYRRQRRSHLVLIRGGKR